MNLESFLGQKKLSSGEMALVQAYRQTLAGFEVKQNALTKCLRFKKSGGNIVPIFSQDAGQIADEMEKSETRMNEIKADIQGYLDALGDSESLTALLDRLHRCRRRVSDSEFAAKNTLARAVLAGAKTVEEAGQSEEVQKVQNARDRIAAEVGPVVKDLETRIQTAKTILEKYSGNDENR